MTRPVRDEPGASCLVLFHRQELVELRRQAFLQEEPAPALLHARNGNQPHAQNLLAGEFDPHQTQCPALQIHRAPRAGGTLPEVSSGRQARTSSSLMHLHPVPHLIHSCASSLTD
ncbi:hypothetical protein CB1_000715004 [Camelus ferus]|nr:hypothetical protein CB1_000715004 [Camelus ferus]